MEIQRMGDRITLLKFIILCLVGNLINITANAQQSANDCDNGQNYVSWTDSGWNGGNGWSNNSSNSQVYQDFDGEGNSINWSYIGTPSGGNSGPNINSSNDFDIDDALRITSNGDRDVANSATDPVVGTISFANPIELHKFTVLGMEWREDDTSTSDGDGTNAPENYNRTEISILQFFNDGAPIDPSGFNLTELVSSDECNSPNAATLVSGNFLYVWGDIEDCYGAIEIDLGGVVLDEIRWEVSNVKLASASNPGMGSDVHGDVAFPPTPVFPLVRVGDNSSQWISGFCYSEVDLSCTFTTAGKTSESCNDNNTPEDSSDDFIRFNLAPIGENLGTTYSVTANNGETVTLTGGGLANNIPYANNSTTFRLQDGSANGLTNYTLTITDDAGNDCQTTTSVIQNACSSQAPCNLSLDLSQPSYNDNNTSSILTDDTFTFEATVIGQGNGGWIGGGQSGSFGETVTFGPYPVDDVGAVFKIFDQTSSHCFVSIGINISSCIYLGTCTCCVWD